MNLEELIKKLSRKANGNKYLRKNMGVQLGWIYRDDYIDLTDIYNDFGHLIWQDLEYVENGEAVTIKAFKYTELEYLEELEYVNTHLENHIAEVYKWMEWLKSYMESIADYDIDDYKSYEKEKWDDDEELKEEHPDFEEYWEEYSTSNELAEVIGWNQQESWNELTGEYQKDAFDVMNKEMSEYFDSYGGIFTGKMDDCLDEGTGEIVDMVKEFAQDKRELDEEDLTSIFDEIFV